MLEIKWQQYESDKVCTAFITHRLFDSIAKVVAEILEYDYPLEAEKCAERYMQIKSD